MINDQDSERAGRWCPSVRVTTYALPDARRTWRSFLVALLLALVVVPGLVVGAAHAGGFGPAQGRGGTVTPWTTYTPTGAWTQNTTYYGSWRMDGEDLEVYVRVETTGAPNAANLAVDLPTVNGWEVDADYNANTASESGPEGYPSTLYQAMGGMTDLGTATYLIAVRNTSATRIAPVSYKVSGSYLTFESITPTVPFTFASGDFVTMRCRVRMRRT